MKRTSPVPKLFRNNKFIKKASDNHQRLQIYQFLSSYFTSCGFSFLEKSITAGVAINNDE